ncbi:MAG: restriction endonuclease [Clostridia bacterium]|nr:restriction endonuclease [Clostridia bacterium]
MMSPFDRKNKVAAALDRIALHALLLALCVGYFFFLWRSGIPSLLAGSALFVLVCLSLMLLERQTLARRERMLRERVGGMIALQDLILFPASRACETVCALLCDTLCAQPLGGGMMRYEDETWLIRCAQCLQGTNASEGDVLSAHRSRIEQQADKCALVSTAGFSPAAVRAAEWMDPPVRLISGRQLALLFGRLHPATDEEIAQHLSRSKKPFSWQRIRALALSPAKLRRYLLCALLLLVFYLITNAPATLAACLLSFVLALLCARENRRSFTL